MDTIKIFVSYSHQNGDWVEEDGKYKLIPWLKKQLEQYDVVFWTDHVLQNHIGEEYEKKIKENIDNSDIAFLLISQEFAASSFIKTKELPWIKEAFDAKRIKKIIPLQLTGLSNLGKKNVEWILALQTIANDTKPLIEYTDNDRNWYDIRIKILNAIEDKIEAIRNERVELEKQQRLERERERLAEQKRLQEEKQKRIEQREKEELRKASIANFNTGYDYYKKGDYSQAVEWYRKAAEQGNADAQNYLGVMYEKGQGVNQDYSQAVEWFRKAAEQGYASAQCNLGVMYELGRGVNQDDAKAVEWYRKAAEQGYATAQYYLGNRYRDGKGVNQDYSQAVEWYKKAAEQGNADAREQLDKLKKQGY